ncbi:MAG: RNA polymerase sigma factor [Spirochaetaceae bacterium]|jgi:RNA polymerase sigma-70 factor (ECF subfamily)|nr:RNA polymerase sigma factor [Spirochaetaceae bacterium]
MRRLSVAFEDDEDTALVSSILAGSKDLYRVLVQKHQRNVYGLGLSFFHNADDAAEFTQDVFLQAFRKLEQFEGKARFSTWLYSIGWRTAVNRKERVKECQSLAEGDYENTAVSRDDTPEESNVKELTRKAVREAVAALPDKYRICVDLYFFYDRSYAEIETITGFPLNTIKSHVFRAKKILREKLTGWILEGE